MFVWTFNGVLEAVWLAAVILTVVFYVLYVAILHLRDWWRNRP